MHTSELPSSFERSEVLTRARTFLQTEADNARLASERPYGMHQIARRSALDEALADFDRGDFEKALVILDRFESVFRARANHEADIEGAPVVDNARANEIGAWIEVLNKGSGSDH
jgi:hypothetical protein